MSDPNVPRLEAEVGWLRLALTRIHRGEQPAHKIAADALTDDMPALPMPSEAEPACPKCGASMHAHGRRLWSCTRAECTVRRISQDDVVRATERRRAARIVRDSDDGAALDGIAVAIEDGPFCGRLDPEAARGPGEARHDSDQCLTCDEPAVWCMKCCAAMAENKGPFPETYEAHGINIAGPKASDSSSPALNYACIGGVEGCTGLAASHGPCASCVAVLAALEVQALRNDVKELRRVADFVIADACAVDCQCCDDFVRTAKHCLSRLTKPAYLWDTKAGQFTRVEKGGPNG